MKTLQQLLDLSCRTALVTGATGFLGKAFSESLCQLGCNLVLTDFSDAELAASASYLTSTYPISASYLSVDLESSDASQVLYDHIRKNHSSLDILVNNAAFVGTSSLDGWSTTFPQQTFQTWDRAMYLNLSVPFLLSQKLEPLLKASRSASIVNIASIYSLIGPDPTLYLNTSLNNPAAYAASKGGLIQLTRWLSTVLAPQIRVNSISPGGLFRDQDPLFVERYTAKTPLNRMGTPEDIVGTLAFLCSDLSAWVTGQNIVVDGGYTIM